MMNLTSAGMLIDVICDTFGDGDAVSAPPERGAGFGSFLRDRLDAVQGWIASRRKRRLREAALQRLWETSPHLIDDVGVADQFDDVPQSRPIVAPRRVPRVAHEHPVSVRPAPPASAEVATAA